MGTRDRGELTLGGLAPGQFGRPPHRTAPPLQAGSVFNFYRPGYIPPGTRLARGGLVSTEMQITTETSVAGYLNFMQSVIEAPGGILGSDLVSDLTPWATLAQNPQALVDKAVLVLLLSG